MKVKNKKEIKKDEFRTYSPTGHPAYIFARVGNDYKFVGVTHSPITDGVENIRLDKNPNPNDRDKSYAHSYSQKDKTHYFSERQRDWKMSKCDKEKLKKIIQ